MKEYDVEFYSNNGYKLGKSTNEYENFSEVEQYVESLMKSDTSIKITSRNTVEFLRVKDIAKVIIIKQG